MLVGLPLRSLSQSGTPNGKNINKEGIEPDTEVKITAEQATRV